MYLVNSPSIADAAHKKIDSSQENLLPLFEEGSNACKINNKGRTLIFTLTVTLTVNIALTLILTLTLTFVLTLTVAFTFTFTATLTLMVEVEVEVERWPMFHSHIIMQ